MAEFAHDRVGVIGAGLGGLAAACTLAARGYRVVLFEQRPALGGKAAVLEDAGYRFDMGPTILTLPALLRRIFAEADRDLADYLDLVPLDPQWRSFFADGTTLDLLADPDEMSAALDRFAVASLPKAPSMAASYRSFLRLSQRMHEVSERYFFSRPIDSIVDMFQAGKLWRPSTLSDVLTLCPGRSVAGTVRSHVGDPRVAQMLDHFTQYVGSAPDQSPAVLCGIAHMQTSQGVWYPRGGIGTVPQALERLARDLGVEVRRGTAIERIVTGQGAVRGVTTDDGRTVPLAAVVSNSDSVRTHRELLADTSAARAFSRRRRYEPACSGVVLYLGL
ncbi:MAG: phytoene desaturase family protein, partial [Pirellulales bacterium]